MCVRGTDALTICVVAGEVGKAASGQVAAEEGPSASPSAVLPSEPQRPAVAADVVPGEFCPLGLDEGGSKPL